MRFVPESTSSAFLRNKVDVDIATIESRFKEVTGLTHLDLSTPHFEHGAKSTN